MLKKLNFMEKKSCFYLEPDSSSIKTTLAYHKLYPMRRPSFLKKTVSTKFLTSSEDKTGSSVTKSKMKMRFLKWKLYILSWDPKTQHFGYWNGKSYWLTQSKSKTPTTRSVHGKFNCITVALILLDLSKWKHVKKYFNK